MSCANTIKKLHKLHNTVWNKQEWNVKLINNDKWTILDNNYFDFVERNVPALCDCEWFSKLSTVSQSTFKIAVVARGIWKNIL